MRRILAASATAALASALASCGSGPGTSSSPTLEQRRAEAQRIRANTEKGIGARTPVTVQRSGNARVDGYRVIMETRRRAMHGVGPRTSDGEAAMRRGKGAE